MSITRFVLIFSVRIEHSFTLADKLAFQIYLYIIPDYLHYFGNLLVVRFLNEGVYIVGQQIVELSPTIVVISFLSMIITLFSSIPSGYYRVFGKFFSILKNDPSYLLRKDTWIEAVIVSLLLLSVADGSLHSLGANCTFGSSISRKVIEITIFNLLYLIVATIVTGMTTIVGKELQYRYNRKIDVPAETIRALLEENIDSMDFTTPLYYFGVSNPYTKAASSLLVMSMTILSTAYILLIIEDVLMMHYHFIPSLLKVNPSTVQHCVESIFVISISYKYFCLTYATGIEKSYSALFMAICVLVIWECVCVGWHYTSYRFLVNIRTMGTTALPVITYKQHISVFLHFFWRYFIPIILLKRSL
ncbi:hypothetical protein DICVIV_13310 [Dictyocaulus viviparus]|uniref:Uncharacterized protein n=1 Tax=Dictyocaulus viviparus TaxID=29172 RepID=A0A0D8XE91_DICVI|nr:hypothetical protein DICVIV_13310 [Dictyocaulus viviparus]